MSSDSQLEIEKDYKEDALKIALQIYNEYIKSNSVSFIRIPIETKLKI